MSTIKLLRGGRIEAYTPDRENGWQHRQYHGTAIISFLQYRIDYCRWTLRDFLFALNTGPGRTVFKYEGIEDYMKLLDVDPVESGARFVDLQRFYEETDYTQLGMGGKEHDISYCASLVGEKQQEDYYDGDYLMVPIGKRRSWSASYTPLAEFIDLPLVIRPELPFHGHKPQEDKRTFHRNFDVFEVYRCIFDDIGFTWRDE
ncbi:hypothetical protein [Achromobacter phage Motura]|uniref:Uncharacterized protein n=1 Tax=Achromobacter phage Motura TaxID=2591403 RepID=A0A514CSY2_9CAUD|nr:hypothetical protein H1O15_gp200 [Achromobacter phage Motura]QDH83588.1 hypothetical protein [Achromobacter phage Motura]